MAEPCDIASLNEVESADLLHCLRVAGERFAVNAKTLEEIAQAGHDNGHPSVAGARTLAGTFRQQGQRAYLLADKIEAADYVQLCTKTPRPGPY